MFIGHSFCMSVLFLGMFANLFYILAGFFRAPTTSMLCAVMGGLVYIIYYYCIGLYPPIVNVGATLMAYVLILNMQERKRILAVSFIYCVVVTFLIGIHFASAYDALLILAAWLIAFSQTQKDNYIFYKLGVMGSQCMWIMYCLHFNDLAMLCTASFILLSNSYSLFINMRKDGLLLPYTRKSLSPVIRH